MIGTGIARLEPCNLLGHAMVNGLGDGTACLPRPTPHAGTPEAGAECGPIDGIEREIASREERGVVLEEYDMSSLMMHAAATLRSVVK